MTLVRKLTFVTSLVGVAFLGLLAAGAVNTADALTLPTAPTVSVTVPPTVVPPPPTVTVPPVTTVLPPPPPPVVTTVPPVTTALPPAPPPPTTTIVLPPPPPPVPTVTTPAPPRPVPTVVTTVPPARPAPPASPPVATTAPQPSGGSPTPAERANGPTAAPAETPSGGTGASVAFASSESSGSPSVATDVSAKGAQADSTRRSSVKRPRVERPGLVRGREGAGGAVSVVFRLPRRGIVVVTVTQVAPACRPMGTFSVRGRAGLNRLRWTGRIGDRLLPAGTYRLALRLVRSGPPKAEPLPAALRGVPVVILSPDTPPRLLEDRLTLDRLRSRNVCRLEGESDQAGSPFAVDLGSLARAATPSRDGSGSVSESDAPTADGSNTEAGGVLGAVATPFAGEGGGSRMAHAILLLLLAPALVLLTFAVAPRAALLRRPAAALAQRHDDLIVLGIGWVVGWVLYIGLVYGLSIALD